MKTKLQSNSIIIVALALLSAFSSQFSTAQAQGTVFTYQGRLNNGTNPATGSFDLTFTLYNALSGGGILAGPITNTAVGVTNGLFTVQVDFGAGVFTGSSNWLAVGVRSNTTVVAFTPLLPREQVTPTPYSIFAETANAGGLSGTVPASALTGVNGSGLVSLNASALASGTVANLRLPPDVALTDANQTFTKVNIFASGGGGAGRLIVSNTFVAVDTNLFTGISLQYDANYGEGAVMSAFNNGEAYLSFYTKAPGYGISKQMTIDFYGTVAIDQGNRNNGFLNNNDFTGTGLTFGGAGTGPGVGPGDTSGEGIASKRTAGGNQNGLDFYTSFTPRMSINNSGFVGIGTSTAVNPADTQFELYSPTTNNYDGMWIATGAGGLPFYGYSEGGGYTAWTMVDGSDGNKWKLYDGGFQLTVTPAGNVGIGTTTPSSALEVAKGNCSLDNGDLFLSNTNVGLVFNNSYGLAYRSGLPGISSDGPVLYGFNGGALAGLAPNTVALSWDYSGDIWVSNNCSVKTLTIRGGADLAEPFNISGTEASEGAVVVIDEQNPGHLKLSDSAYDTHVAGVVSGAKGIHPGIQMHQDGLLEGGKNVALTGRVYVQADISNGAIRPGDLLTTSSTPGHAMRVSDHGKAAGAILGKAMTGLSEGQGMVLVLVTLQ